MQLLIAAFIFLIGSTWAQQPAPSPLSQPAIAGQPDHKAEEPKQQAAPEHHAPAPVPSIVKIPERENAQKDAKPNSTQSPNEPAEAKGLNLSDKIAAIASVVALLQFCALVVTIAVMMVSARRQLRAYVGVLGGEMTYINLADGSHGLAIHIEFKNFGQTPCYKLTNWIKPPKILAKESIPFDEPTPIAERDGESMVGPGANFNVYWTLPIADAELAAVNCGDKRIFVWGGIDFTDAFRQHRFFIFRMTNDRRQISIPGERFALRPHKIGYDAN